MNPSRWRRKREERRSKLKTDFEDVLGAPAEEIIKTDVFRFKDNKGKEYSFPAFISSEVSLLIADLWDDLTPMMAIMAKKGSERREFINSLGDAKHDIIKKSDETVREILSYWMNETNPEITAEWLKDNLNEAEYYILAFEVLQKAMSFFLSKARNADHVAKNNLSLMSQVKDYASE